MTPRRFRPSSRTFSPRASCVSTSPCKTRRRHFSRCCGKSRATPPADSSSCRVARRLVRPRMKPQPGKRWRACSAGSRLPRSTSRGAVHAFRWQGRKTRRSSPFSMMVCRACRAEPPRQPISSSPTSSACPRFGIRPPTKPSSCSPPRNAACQPPQCSTSGTRRPASCAGSIE